MECRILYRKRLLSGKRDEMEDFCGGMGEFRDGRESCNWRDNYRGQIFPPGEASDRKIFAVGEA